MQTDGNADRAEGFGAAAFAAILRREAERERPGFAAGFHGDLMRRLVRKRRPVGSRRPSTSSGTERLVRQRRGWLRAAAVLAGGGAAAGLIGAGVVDRGVSPSLPNDAAGRGLVSSTTFSSRAAVPDQAAAGGDDLIERLPLFDEIDAEIRSSVATVASALLAVPDWRALAEFDAAGLLGGGSDP
jgi:hypothetical protein